MTNYSIVVDFSDIAELAHASPSAAETLSRRVQLINVVFGGTLQAIDRDDIPQHMVSVWAGPASGEGILYRAIAREIDRIVTFDFDAESDLSKLEDDLNNILNRFRPRVVSTPLSWSQLADADSQKRRRARAQCARVVETCRAAGVDANWDIQTDTSSSAVATSETMKIMEWLQDRGLDPSGWTIDLPDVERELMLLVARAHIDGQTDVRLLFRTRNASLSADLQRVDAIKSYAGTPAPRQIYVGASHLIGTLAPYIAGSESAGDASNKVAQLIAELASAIPRELAIT